MSNLTWFFIALGIVLALIAGYASSLFVRRQRLESRIEQIEKGAH